MKHDKNQGINGLTCNFFHSPGITTVHLYHEPLAFKKILNIFPNPSNYMFIDMHSKKVVNQSNIYY